MTPTVAILPPSRRRFRRVRESRLPAAVLLAAVTAAVVILLNAVVFNDPAFVDHIAFQNDSSYDIHISVSNNGADVLPIGAALQHCTTTFEQVIDQGSTWHIRFRAQGRDGGEAIVNRTDLVGADWSYHIPDSVAEQLRSAGAPTSPKQSCSTAP